MSQSTPDLPHSHIVRDDLRGPLLPVDNLSHISRINGWKGSDSWVEGCRADKGFGDEEMDENYPEPKLPYKLLTKAYHDGAMRKPGEIVYVRPSQRGVQHAKIPGQEYPDLPEPEPPGTDVVPRVADAEARVAKLEERVAAAEKAIADMHAALSDKGPASVQRAVADVQVPTPANG